MLWTSLQALLLFAGTFEQEPVESKTKRKRVHFKGGPYNEYCAIPLISFLFPNWKNHTWASHNWQKRLSSFHLESNKVELTPSQFDGLAVRRSKAVDFELDLELWMKKGRTHLRTIRRKEENLQENATHLGPLHRPHWWKGSDLTTEPPLLLHCYEASAQGTMKNTLTFSPLPPFHWKGQVLITWLAKGTPGETLMSPTFGVVIWETPALIIAWAVAPTALTNTSACYSKQNSEKKLHSTK